MKSIIRSILRVIAGILGIAFLPLAVWMAFVAKDILFAFYCLVLAAVLIKAAVTNPRAAQDEVCDSSVAG